MNCFFQVHKLILYKRNRPVEGQAGGIDFLIK